MSTGVLPLPRITYHSAEEPEILLRLEANDADVGGLTVRFDEMNDAYRGNWAKRVGEAIGKSTHLRKLGILGAYYSPATGAPPAPPFGLPSLFMGLAENRSIEELSLTEFNHTHMNIFTTLASFFENNPNLRCIHIVSMSEMPSKMNVPSFVSVLASTSKLEQIDISNNYLGDIKTADIIDVLANLPGLHHLLELNLGGNAVRKKGCNALRKLLRNPTNNLQKLFLNNNDIGDACVDILYDGLVANNSLQFINLQHQKNITSSGWSVFFDVLSNSVCSLDMILVCENNLGDDGAISLGKSLLGSTRLEVMHLRDCTNVTSVGWRWFSRGLSSNSSIISLDLSNCNIDDYGALCIASALAKNTVLQRLEMESIGLITSAGWKAFFRQLTMCVSPSLTTLSFYGNEIDDDGITLLAIALPKMGKLQTFSMTSISANRWGYLVDMLKPSSAIELRELHLGKRDPGLESQREPIDDDIIIPFADALVMNTTLVNFSLTGYNFSERSWTVLENVFCNKSSIDGTFCSNHTLYSFGFSQMRLCLESLLSMNYDKDKYGVARKKILLHHFGEFDSILDVVGPLSTPVLPFALSWLGRDRYEYSMMFQMLQNMPWLIGSAINSNPPVRESLWSAILRWLKELFAQIIHFIHLVVVRGGFVLNLY